MEDNLLNETTIARYKLDQIDALTQEECVDGLQLLNYLLRRAESDEEKLAVINYIENVNKRMVYLLKS